MHRSSPALLILTLLWATLVSPAVTIDAAEPNKSAEASATAERSGDWTYWRGPNFDGISPATGLPESWNSEGGEGSNLLWKREDLGGRSTPVVMNGRLYTVLRAEPGTRREAERVVCLDAATGEMLWENRFNVWLSDVPAERVGWSSVVADPETGYVYVLGVCDYFACIDGETGKTVWSVPLHEEYGMLSTYGGRTNFPVISDDLVIISGIIINWGDRAKPNHRLLGFDKRTGKLVWFQGSRDLPDDTTYSAPSVVTINGQKQVILGLGDGAVWGFQPRTGRPLWHYDLSRRGLFATPLVVGDRVYASHGEENMDGETMGAVVALKISGTGEDTVAEEVWKIEELVVSRSTPVLVDGRLYIVDDRCKLWIIDAESGEMIGERIAIGDRKQWASLLYADEKIYVLTENGRWAVLKPTEEGVEFLDKGRLRDEAFNASPIVANGRLYFQGTSALYCVGSPEAGKASEAASASAAAVSSAGSQELPVSENPEPAWLQIVPAEALIQPGETVSFEPRLYNALGQPLDASTEGITYEIEGEGSISGNTYTAPSDAKHQAAIITARLGDVTGVTRVRVIPPLPWKFDFDQADDAPQTWIGVRYRHVIRPVDGSPALVKISTIPKGARSQAWMGPSDLANYTISADVRGTIKEDQMPDIGLIAQGYTLDLQGNAQALQIRTWTPQLRMAQTVPFAWEPDKWYRIKFQASSEDDPSTPSGKVAVLRGKVWPRDAEEPAEWTVTARDESPQLTGSPGLFGNAQVTELFIDNLEVTPNESE